MTDSWGSPAEREARLRIKLCVWAYAYEYRNDEIVPDHVFDSEALRVNLALDTGNPEMDRWFRENFDPSTGMWIKNHPEIEKIDQLYWRYYRKTEAKRK